MQKIKIIVAATENNAIGRNGELLFHLKEDMKNFKKLTSGNIVIMGRKTYESIGKALPNRINVVLSRGKIDDNEVVQKSSLEEAIQYAKIVTPYLLKDIYIIGGGQIYKKALENGIVDEIILTRVNTTVDDADTFFPKLDYDKDWNIKLVQSYEYGMGKTYDICYLEKKNKEILQF